MSVNKWSDVKCSDVEWTDVIYVKWFCFERKWSEVSYSEVLGDKSTMYIRVTLHWGDLIILWLFHLGISCTVFVLTCAVVVLTCFVMCVCVGFVMCWCEYVWVCLYLLCFVFFVLCFLYCFVYVYLFLFVLSVLV